ncbi:hypothetical protein [Gordonia westfalica]|uniref:Uncharacterized protein n=1 Tax=Gordonia westfalica TaxID=158898 RepID=A0A1H2EJ61_9ACTN|nr:hypothetical protein [Gordonia westfalica]SDT94993.1 hypothetical protein SAMN04488548_13223 [Gordonia westfalica]
MRAISTACNRSADQADRTARCPASVVANADAAPANKVQQLTQADLKNMSQPDSRR